MKYGPAKQRRRAIRLRDYDYTTPGSYFVTITAVDRTCLFGDITDGEMRLNDAGRIVQTVWRELPSHYPHVPPDAYIVMPNHIHGIIVLSDRNDVGAGFKPAPTRHGIPEIVRAFKTFSARRINEMRCTPRVSIWQRNYFEHIIRSEESLNRIRQYILDNPARWDFDRENPAVTNPEKDNAWLTDTNVGAG